MPQEARRLPSFPRNDLLDEPVLSGRAAELELIERLGPPTTESSRAFDDPRIFWDLEWPCGLVMGIEYHQLTEELVMHLDSLDIEHAVRHLGVEVRALATSFEHKRDRFDRLTPRPVEGLWTVVAEESDGSTTLVARNISERDARCRAAELDEVEPHRTFTAQPVRG
jgi:hypothetical protein